MILCFKTNFQALYNNPHDENPCLPDYTVAHTGGQ